MSDELIRHATPGKWKLDPGERGFPGTREEPPEPGWEPFVYVDYPEGAKIPADDDAFRLCTVHDTMYLIETEEEYDPGEREYGDAGVNARLFEHAKHMAELLTKIRNTVELPFELRTDVIDVLMYINLGPHVVTSVFNVRKPINE